MGYRWIPVLACAGLLLSGCATKPQPQPLTSDPAVKMLAEAARLAQQDLGRLSRAEDAIAESSRSQLDRTREARAQAVVPPGWDRTTTEVFTLPYDRALERLASLAGYRLYPAGKIPANPVMVSVKGEGRRLVDVMRDITAQMPTDMTVFLYPATRSVVLAPKK